MSWLNLVFATPLIGVQIVPDYTITADCRKIVAPLLNELAVTEKSWNYTELKSWGIRIDDGTGYKYRFEKDNLICNFDYPLEYETISGKLPILKKQDLKQYSELLTTCFEKLKKMAQLILDAGHFLNVSRFGYVAKIALDPSRLPPGIKILYEYLSKPWANGLVKVETTLLASLYEDDNITDRCHHSIALDMTVVSSQMDVILDWQRLFKESQKFEHIDDFTNNLQKGLDAALVYFEKIGEKGVNDE